ncbi:MAG: RraA family protein [Bryobacteraceae bacterium]|jgi:regulator of RNase E activity RraA
MRLLRLRKSDFEQIRKLDTYTVSNAIERLKARPRNEGSVPGPVLHCQFPHFEPMLGYAATGRIRSTSAPVSGRAYHENMHWWRYVASIPEPRVMVIQDVDEQPGAAALVGELHAVIGRALKCVGYVTNGAVRDLPGVESVGFHLFAGSVAVSHMYAHVSEYGRPIQIGGLEIRPGDLIHGDRHGVQTVPLTIASQIPEMASEILREERELKEFCQSPRFSLQGLDEKLQKLPGDGFEMPLGALGARSDAGIEHYVFRNSQPAMLRFWGCCRGASHRVLGMLRRPEQRQDERNFERASSSRGWRRKGRQKDFAADPGGVFGTGPIPTN